MQLKQGFHAFLEGPGFRILLMNLERLSLTYLTGLYVRLKLEKPKFSAPAPRRLEQKW